MISMVGGDQINANLDRLSMAVRGKVLRRALMETAEPIKEAAKAFCPVSDGTGESVPGVLRDSIEIKFTARIGGGSYTGGFGMVIIGPRRGIRVPIRVITRGVRAGQVKFAVPTKYAHLVEFGHAIKDHTGKVIGHVGPKPYMRPAWDIEGGERALDRFTAIMETDLETEVANLPTGP